MLNQNGFICANLLHIRFANVTPFDRPEEMHCITVHSRMLYIYTIKLFYYFREKMHCMYLVVLYLFQINVLRHNHLHYHQDHLWYLFQDLDYLTWACALLANSNNCIFTIFIQSDISNVISNALLGTSRSQSGFNNGNILQIMFTSVTPICPPEKCKVVAYAVQAVFLDPINVGSLVA